ncbi:DUF1818 family protein [Leptolyngbya sp. FACHB-261]|uniref:DUF1818 family protein n=1 Tax=Leptolyngbya sp. FACHB-261 TaxID=2692806 RepID=UPI0016825611|nr:DUF1818 family protein [Leptolyngbya sp. FACHB-261]MBD2103548.1 DUF1818 family protein [Leptolyngbya sp. FACHB-261]
MSQRKLLEGPGWRLGWAPGSELFVGLVGSDLWSLELTNLELRDFCRLLLELSESMAALKTELMDEETLVCEAETEQVWLEARGFPDRFGVSLQLQTGRRADGQWQAEAVPGLILAVQELQPLLNRPGISEWVQPF